MRPRPPQVETKCADQVRAMNETSPITNAATRIAHRAAAATPSSVALKVRGLSDTAIAWLFIAPTIVLLLAINIFPLIWTIQLSFTNYRANRPNAAVRNVGIENYT